jgi:ribosome biogenesis GTPase / thiamine phosphate phosphatase
MPSGGEEGHGLVRSAVGGVYEVELHQGGVVEASLRGRLKQQQRTGDAVVVGDRVEVCHHEDGSHTIESVADRVSELARTSPRDGRHRAKVMAANVDQIVAVFAVSHPAPHLRMLDRFLVLAEANELGAVIVANKTDLGSPADLDAFRVYETVGYPVLFTSAATGDGLEALRDLLCGRISSLAGPSGVGKSTLLNALEPGLALRTGEVSEAVGKGRHTTVSARLIPLACGGYVADTPGLREVGLWGIDPTDLDLHFPEFRAYVDECRYGRSCSHTHEPACGVQGAVAAGAIPGTRYESYVALFAGDD